MIYHVQTPPIYIQHVQETQVVVIIDQRLKLLDVDKMTVVRSFQGLLYYYAEDCTHIINNGKGRYIIIAGLQPVSLSSLFVLRFISFVGRVYSCSPEGRPGDF